jgi:hypothetical protein
MEKNLNNPAEEVFANNMDSSNPGSPNISSDCSEEIVIRTSTLATLCSKPFLLVPDPGENKVIEFIDAVFIYKFGGEPMSGGGSIYISYLGFSALSAGVSAITLTGEMADKVIQMQLVNTADNPMPFNSGLYLQMTESDFEQGASTSSAKIHIIYRIHTIV